METTGTVVAVVEAAVVEEGISAGEHTFEGAGGLGPGNGLSWPYCFPSRTIRHFSNGPE